ncbi:MAG: Lrp/AsnC family transcriptional regulator [archaeon]
MKVDDEIRLNILKALLDKSCVQPNLRRIKAKTHYHLATIKGSIDFMQKEGIVSGYGPKIASWKLGYKLEAVELLQLDFSRPELVEKYMAVMSKDSHVYGFQSIMGSGNFNVISFQFYRDVESYHKNLQDNYIKKIPNYYDIVKDRQVFYLTEPTFKRGSRTDCILSLMRRDAGLD